MAECSRSESVRSWWSAATCSRQAMPTLSSAAEGESTASPAGSAVAKASICSVADRALGVTGDVSQASSRSERSGTRSRVPSTTSGK